MTLGGSTLIEMAARLGLFILVAGMLLIAYRIVRGPRNADRIISLDLLSVLVVALLVLYSIYSGEKAYLDVAIAYALVAFLGTVAFARFVERSSPGSHFPPEESREENKRE